MIIEYVPRKDSISLVSNGVKFAFSRIVDVLISCVNTLRLYTAAYSNLLIILMSTCKKCLNSDERSML